MRKDIQPDGSVNVILERRTCNICSGTRVTGNWKRCPNENRAQRGKPCDFCGATKKYAHHHVRVGEKVCDFCDENGTVAETVMDYVPNEWWREFEFYIATRTNREASFNESFLGFGYIYTSNDYGARRNWSDEQLIEKIKTEHTSTQLTSVLTNPRARDTDVLTLVPFIAIERRSDGYNVGRPRIVTPNSVATTA